LNFVFIFVEDYIQFIFKPTFV